jgi:hypothetical protein
VCCGLESDSVSTPEQSLQANQYVLADPDTKALDRVLFRFQRILYCSLIFFQRRWNGMAHHEGFGQVGVRVQVVVLEDYDLVGKGATSVGVNDGVEISGLGEHLSKL